MNIRIRTIVLCLIIGAMIGILWGVATDTIRTNNTTAKERAAIYHENKDR